VSLSRLLRDRRGPVRAFFEQRLPNLQGVHEQWRLLGPPTVLSPPGCSSSGTIGTAFDYRLRYFFTVTSPCDFAARHGVDSLAIQAAAVGDDPLAAIKDRLVRGARIYQRMIDAIDPLIERLHPVGRRLGKQDEELLCRWCYVLALYEECYRSSHACASTPLLSLDEEPSCDELLSLPPEPAIADLGNLTAALYDSEFASWFWRPVLASPHFSGSPLVSGADGDLIVDDCLIDVKTTKSGMRREWVYQLIGYVLLDLEDDHRIERVGFYRARVPGLVIWSLHDLLAEAAGHPVEVSDLRAEFLALLATMRSERQRA
jgi:hypothetical protein